MPRETITTADSAFDVEVGWGRDAATVEVAVTAPDGTDRIIGIVTDWAKALGVPTTDLDVLREKLATSPYTFDGWHAHIDDRTQVNTLVRTLRKARDMAFGPDA